MTAIINATGLQIQTLQEVTDETAVELEALGFRTDLESSFGQLKRIWGEQEAATQEALLAVYNTLSFFAEGAHLERVVALLGVERRPALASRVAGRATGTVSHTIVDGTQLRYEPNGSIWEVIEDTDLGLSGDAEILIRAVDVGQPLTANVGHDFTATLSGTSGGPNAIGDYEITFTGFDLAVPVTVTFTATQPPTPSSIVAGIREAILSQNGTGGDIEGVVRATRRVGTTLEIWTDPDLPSGTITFASTTFETPSMDFAPFAVWTILGDSDFLTFTAVQQASIGAPVETDAGLRARATIEAFRRGQGPLKAIEAAVTQVEGVTHARCYEHTGHPDVLDANGIPGRSINLVVEGGVDAEIADALLASRPAGIQMWGSAYDEIHHLGPSQIVRVRFDRVEEVLVWIRYDAALTDEAPPDAVAAIEQALLTGAEKLFGIGDDITPWKLYGSVKNAAIPGIDDIEIQISVDNGGAPLGYQSAKLDISIRQRGRFSPTRIESA